MMSSAAELSSILERVLPNSSTMQYERMGSSGEARVHNGNVYNITIVFSSDTRPSDGGDEPSGSKKSLNVIQDDTSQVDPVQAGTAGNTKIYTITPDDVLIAVMGITGCGKSTFVNYLADYCADVGAGLESKTKTLQIIPATLPGTGRRIYLMDTPGFDDTNISDKDVLTDIATWLTSTYQNSIRLTGLIYLHPIRDNRLRGSALRNVRMFQKLCGNDALGKVVLATSMWDITERDTALAREAELRSSNRFWKSMIDGGSRLLRHDSGAKSAQAIVEYLISLRDSTVLDLQREMVDEALPLKDTSAGKELQTELQQMQQKHEEELLALRKELAEVRAVNDRATSRVLERVIEDSEKQFKRPGQLSTSSMDSTAHELYIDRAHSALVPKFDRAKSTSKMTISEPKPVLRPFTPFSSLLDKFKSWSDSKRSRRATKDSQRFESPAVI